jgi:hypothetical protein
MAVDHPATTTTGIMHYMSLFVIEEKRKELVEKRRRGEVSPLAMACTTHAIGPAESAFLVTDH